MKTIIAVLFVCSVAGSQVASVQQSSKHHSKSALKFNWAGTARTTFVVSGDAAAFPREGMTWHPAKKLPWDVRDHWTEVIRGGKAVAIITQDGHTILSPGEDPAEITSFMLRLVELTSDMRRSDSESHQKQMTEALAGWRRSNGIARACLIISNKSILPKGKRVPRS
jgi:hypothetical protein